MQISNLTKNSSNNKTMIGIGAVLAFVDVISMSYMKNFQNYRPTNLISWIKPLIIPCIIYMFQPILFMTGLQVGGSITVLNLVWDLFSGILVTLTGLLLFKESLSPVKYTGVMFAVVGLICFILDESHDTITA